MRESWKNSVTDGRTDRSEFIGPSDSGERPVSDVSNVLDT